MEGRVQKEAKPVNLETLIQLRRQQSDDVCLRVLRLELQNDVRCKVLDHMEAVICILDEGPKIWKRLVS